MKQNSFTINGTFPVYRFANNEVLDITIYTLFSNNDYKLREKCSL